MLHRELLACLLLSAPPLARADVRLPALFSDHGVLQQGREIPVWGTAAPGEAVSVAFAGQSFTAVADPDGRWRVKLPPHAAGGPYELVVKGRNEVRVRDLLVGEVWICSGQSNMTLPLTKTTQAASEIAQADFPKLRLFTACRNVAEKPLAANGGAWAVCTPKSVANYSATAYYFGKELQAKLQVPVGLVHASWAGVPGESWVSLAALQADPDFKPVFDTWAGTCEKSKDEIAAYEPQFQQWRREAEAAGLAGRTFPQPPDGPEGPRHHYYPGNCYHGMIAPLMPFAMRGVIWYQGEGNRDRAGQYQRLLTTLIRDWRSAWQQGDFPFGIVELANVGKPAEHGGGGYADVREAQRLAARSLTNCGLVVTCDTGDADDVHAKNKRDVGLRLARWAQGAAYGQPVETSGPLFEALQVRDGKAVVLFTHCGAGLVAKGGGELTGFYVAGADGRFVRATAAIAGDTVVVSAPDVAAPVRVDYAWADNPVCNLYNRDGLPASPFRAGPAAAK